MTMALLGTHQMEEVVFSIETWSDAVGGTGWSWLDAHIEGRPPLGNLMSSTSVVQRVAAVTAQAGVASLLYLATRRHATASRLVTTALCLGWGAAFVMHITVAARTRSAMPGLATSLVPGIPGMVFVLRRIWT